MFLNLKDVIIEETIFCLYFLESKLKEEYYVFTYFK